VDLLDVDDETGCYITGVGGDWSGANMVAIDTLNHPAQLYGTLNPSMHAAARCIGIAGTAAVPPVILDPAISGRTAMGLLETGCFYNQIQGPFNYPLFGGGRLDMQIETIGGKLRWTGGVGGQSQGGIIFCDSLSPP